MRKAMAIYAFIVICSSSWAFTQTDKQEVKRIQEQIRTQEKREKAVRKLQEKEALARPLRINVNAGPEKIKPVIIRAMVNRHYEPDTGTDYQLTFTGGEARGSNAFAYKLGASMRGSETEQMREEVKFVFVADEDRTEVIAHPSWVRHTRSGAVDRQTDNSKETHLLLIQALDEVKTGVEGQAVAK